MKLQINKKVSTPKSAMFAVVDSINFYVQTDSLKDLNVPKLADKIVTDTRREYGEAFTKANIEIVLNKTIKSMTTTAKSTIKADKPQVGVVVKKEIKLTEEDSKIVNSADSLNKRVAQLSHLWDHPAVLAKEFGKSRQRMINAIKLAKNKK